jgi:Tfp pilus assembly protein PilF
MNEEVNQATLEELRRLRSLCRRMFYVLLLILIAGVLSIPISRHPAPASKPASWEQVTILMRQQDFPRALAEAQVLVGQEPNYYYGHAYLGAIYLAMGPVTNAEAEYARAYVLFPTEQTEKDLAAVRQRLPVKLLSR